MKTSLSQNPVALFKYAGSLVFWVTLMFHQPAKAQGFDAGLVIGTNLSQVDGDAMGGFHRIGFVGGGRVDAVFSERWRLGMELLFSQLGRDRSQYDFLSDYDNIRLNYVEVPVSINFRDWTAEWGTDETFQRMEFSAGMSYARLMNFKVISVSGENVSEIKNYNPNSIFINFGGTFFISPRIGIHAHWSKQLNDLDRDVAEYLVSRFINIKAYYYFN